MKTYLQPLFEGKYLSREQAYHAMGMVKKGLFRPEEMGAFVAALRARKESYHELAGFVDSLLEDVPASPIDSSTLVDCCGTGGDGLKTFNISTTVGFVLAAGGVSVAKHGNRSVSSKCGSADVIEALGIPNSRTLDEAKRSLDEHSYAFLFAPDFHSSLRNVVDVRRNLGVRTVFNILGPLLNPFRAKRQVIGVFSSELISLVAETLRALGKERAIVVCSEDGMDEFSTVGINHYALLEGEEITYHKLDAKELGLNPATHQDLVGGETSLENAQIISSIFQGEKGAKRDIVCLNAAAGFLVAGKAKNFAEGIALAEKVLDQGLANELLQNLRGLQ